MKRSKFSLSNTKLFSGDMGELIPCGITEVLPGDTLQQATSCLVRASPLLAPVMHQVQVRIHHWYVPHRIVWEEWEDFITGGPDGMDASEFPTITFSEAVEVGSLADYLGVPTGVSGLEVSALPFRAYAMIFNEWYRDQDLITPLVISEESGEDTTTNTALQNIGWEKDYFTSARPWEQKGPQITIPLGTTAPVVTNNEEIEMSVDNVVNSRIEVSDSDGAFYLNTTPNNNEFARFGSETGLQADLSGASAASINLLREAFALQRYEEARARYGSRYTEYLRYLGIRSSDARLQRPEYLGGGKNVISFSEVLQTAEGTDPVGEMRGHGIAATRSNRYRRFFEEHGYVISLISVRPKTIYQNGLFRHWNRRYKEDYWQKELQHIGQQEILNKELYAGHSSPDGTFGFQDRYDEYRRQESTVSGEFRTLLNFWHMSRDFGTQPALNASFVECVPTDRTFAVPTQDTLYCMARHSIQARRMVAKTGSSFIF